MSYSKTKQQAIGILSGTVLLTRVAPIGLCVVDNTPTYHYARKLMRIIPTGIMAARTPAAG